jgi:hypothetical protein
MCRYAHLSARTEGGWGVEVELHPFLNSALDGGERLVTRTGKFSPGEEWATLPRFQSRSERHVSVPAGIGP